MLSAYLIWVSKTQWLMSLEINVHGVGILEVIVEESVDLCRSLDL